MTAITTNPVTVSEFTPAAAEAYAHQRLGKGTATSGGTTYYLSIHYALAGRTPVPTIVWVFLSEGARERSSFRGCIGAVHRDGIDMCEGYDARSVEWVRKHRGVPGWQGRTLDGTCDRWMAGATLAEAVASVIARHEG